MTTPPNLPAWFTPSKARRLIDHGDRLLSRRPHRRCAIWREKNFEFRVSVTSFRLLLDYRAVRDLRWQQSYCRWL